MIKVGDKIKLEKPICVLGERFVGKTFRVTKVDNTFIYFTSSEGAGGIGISQLDEYFSIVENKKVEDKTVEDTKECVRTNSKFKDRLKSIFKVGK